MSAEWQPWELEARQQTAELAALTRELLHIADDVPPPARQNSEQKLVQRTTAPTGPAVVLTPQKHADEPVWPASVTLADVKPEHVEWLWQGRLARGKVVMLDGDPSLGKSTMLLDFAARVSTGTPWPDGTPCERGHALLMSAEDGLADTIRPRLDAAGADVSRVHAILGVPYQDDDTGKQGRRPPSLPEDVAFLEERTKHYGASLVVVDVLMAYLGGRVNAHRDHDIRRVMAELAAMAERTRAVVVLLRHLNKSGGDQAMYRGGGSIGIIGAARAGFVVGKDPDDDSGERRVFACVKNNLAPESQSLAYRLVSAGSTSRVEWLGNNEHSASELLARDSPEERDERDAAVDVLRSLLTERGGSAPAADCLKALSAAGCSQSRNVVARARKRAGIDTRKASFGGGWEWFLPGG